MLDGFAGPDTIFGGPGLADTVIFQASLSVLRTSSLWVTLDDAANDGTDLTLNGVSEEGDNVHSDVETVEGGNARDLLVGDGDANALTGFGGDDSLDGQGGADQLLGLDGNDMLFGRDGADYLGGGDGTDDFFEDGAPNGADDMWGGPGGDSVHYSNRSWPVGVLLDDLANDGDFATGEGDNVHTDIEDAVGGSGPDAFQGSSAVNHLTGGAGNDGMHGNDGNDVLSGGVDNDSLYGDAGDDALRGGPGNDDEHGDAGQDVMLQDSGANGADTFSDSDFNATVDYSSRTTAIVVHMDAAANDGEDANGDWIAEEGDNVDPSISVVDSGSGRDLLTGRTVHLPGAPNGPVLKGNIGDDYLAGGNGASGPNSFGTFLNGGAGNDWLEGSAWSDNLSGGPGNDTERGNDSDDVFDEGSTPNGADEIWGNGSCCGPGGARDTIDYGSRWTSVQVDLDDSADDGDPATSEGDNIHSDVEVIEGGHRDDVLTGNAADNIIRGNFFSDQIDGGPGDDILYGDFSTPCSCGGYDTVDGGDGDDIILGEFGDDTLFGGNGDDVITGGGEDDAMDGGDGSDILHAQDGFVDAVDGGPGADAADFDPNDVVVNIP